LASALIRSSQAKKKGRKNRRVGLQHWLETAAVARSAIALILAAVTVFLLTWRGIPFRLPEVEGQTATRDIIATVDFSYPDRVRTEQAVLGGVGSAFTALIALSLFESGFRVFSDIGLLELSDLNHPLLQELMLRAPGTYHHSLIMGALAERAASEVGLTLCWLG